MSKKIEDYDPAVVYHRMLRRAQELSLPRLSGHTAAKLRRMQLRRVMQARRHIEDLVNATDSHQASVSFGLAMNSIAAIDTRSLVAPRLRTGPVCSLPEIRVRLDALLNRFPGSRFRGYWVEGGRCIAADGTRRIDRESVSADEAGRVCVTYGESRYLFGDMLQLAIPVSSITVEDPDSGDEVKMGPYTFILSITQPELEAHGGDIDHPDTYDLVCSVEVSYSDGCHPGIAEHPHPHISEEGEVCFGDATEPFQAAVQQGRLDDAVDTMLSMLSVYNDDSPFDNFVNFTGNRLCSSCGASVDPDDGTAEYGRFVCNDCVVYDVAGNLISEERSVAFDLYTGWPDRNTGGAGAVLYEVNRSRVVDVQVVERVSSQCIRDVSGDYILLNHCCICVETGSVCLQPSVTQESYRSDVPQSPASHSSAVLIPGLGPVAVTALPFITPSTEEQQNVRISTEYLSRELARAINAAWADSSGQISLPDGTRAQAAEYYRRSGQGRAVVERMAEADTAG